MGWGGNEGAGHGSGDRLVVWFVYILRCADDSLYTGITTDVARRLAEHNTHDRLGARYTRARRPVRLAYVEPCASRAEAARREAAIRRLGRAGKAALCATALPLTMPPCLRTPPTPTAP